MESEPVFETFASRAALVEAVSCRVVSVLTAAIMRDGCGEIAASGGSTPEALYKTLGARDDLDWEQLRVTLVDERWVGTDHPRSNEAFVRGAFADADPEIVGLYNGAPTPDAALDDIAARLSDRKKPFDVVVLGLGVDGHTASWFPDADGLADVLTSGSQICTVKAKPSDVTGDEVERMTLTLAAIKDAELIVLMIVGDAKKAAFEQVLEMGPVEDMPARAILRTRPDMMIAWAP